MAKFTARAVAFYDLPVQSDINILRVEQVILRLPMGKTVDIGALCFLKREMPSKDKTQVRRSWEGTPVSISSFFESRAGKIRKFIAYISERMCYGKESEMTLYSVIRNFVMFVNWADVNNYSNALENDVTTRLAAEAYVAHIRHRVSTFELGHDTGARRQQETLKLLSDFQQIDFLARGINVLRRDTRSAQATTPPSDVIQGRALTLCEALFKGLVNLVLDFKKYPFGIYMPSYLGYTDDTMWVFPVKVWCKPPSRLALGEASFTGQVFEYSTGILHSRAEVESRLLDVKASTSADAFRRKVSRAVGKAKKLIDDANIQNRHQHRISMAQIAANSFILLFLSRTGMNWAQMVSLRWSNSAQTSYRTIRQRFREIKFRAGNKMVSYQLPLQFMPEFEKYLQLRNFLLHDYPDFDGLFFTMGLAHAQAPTYIRTGLATTYRSWQRIDPQLIPVLSRQWRAAKSDFLIVRTDVSTAAMVLQNSEDTVRKSYAAGAVETHLSEMSRFLDQMVVKRGVDLQGHAVAAGECVSFFHSKESPHVEVAVTPDCENPEIGCLFCENFKVHADVTDVRKLLSCRYCMNRTSHLAGFHKEAGAIVNRIDKILDEIGKREPLLVSRIAEEVDEGELDSYWANKFDMLLRLGLVNDIE